MRKRKIWSYIRNFGIFHGLYLFITIRKSKNSGTIRFKLPGMAGAVFLRRDGSDFQVFEEIFIDEEYAGGNLPARADYIIDAGANIGLFTLLMLKRYPKATIICIEPESTNFELLEKNVSSYRNVHCLKKALWHEGVSLMIKNRDSANWAFEITEQKIAREAEITALTMAELITGFGLPCIDLIKIDIEGSEKELFSANLDWLAITKQVIVEIHEDTRPGAHQAVMDALLSRNFTFVQSGPLYFFSQRTAGNA